jgi:hypothetical protein
MAALERVTGDENLSQSPGLLKNAEDSKRLADCFLGH